MYRLSLAAFVLLISTFASATAAVSGKLVNPDTTGGIPGYAEFQLENCGGNYPIVTGASIAPRQTFNLANDGTWSGVMYRNDEITCNGSASTWWRMTYFVNSRQTGPARDFICSQSSCAFDSMTPLSVYPALPSPVPVSGSVLTAPLGPQTITGGFGLTNSGPLTGTTLTGTTSVVSPVGTIKNINAIRFADQFAGADIGVKVNAAFTDCSSSCIVRVPAGSYSYSTTINVPDINGGNVELVLDSGAYLTYAGSGDAILITPANAGVINSNSIRISGGQLIGTSAAASGIHLQATARNTITGIDITGFSTGAGIFCEGCMNNLFQGVQSRNNRTGYKEQPISIFASTYTNNANVWVGGHIQANTLFGVAAYVPPAIGSGGVAGNFVGVTIEGNGGFSTLNATAATDNATCALAGMCINSNTVTVTTTGAHGFVVGQLVDQTAAGTCFSGRYSIASVPSSTTYTYTCTAANAHTGAGTIKGYSGNVFLEGGHGESFIGGYMEPAVNDGTVKATIYLGDSNFAPDNVNIRNVNFQSLGVVNTIDNFNGGVSVDGDREGANNTNFFNQELATGVVFLGSNAVSSSNYLVGTALPAGSLNLRTMFASPTFTGTTQVGRIRATQSSALVSGDFALSGGFGSTASVGSILGTDAAFSVTVTSAGSGQAANPTLTLTFHDGTWTNSPLCVPATGPANDTRNAIWAVSSVSATQLILQLIDTPIAATHWGVTVNCSGR